MRTVFDVPGGHCLWTWYGNIATLGHEVGHIFVYVGPMLRPLGRVQIGHILTYVGPMLGPLALCSARFAACWGIVILMPSWAIFFAERRLQKPSAPCWAGTVAYCGHVDVILGDDDVPF